jgi:hypothetical protein
MPWGGTYTRLHAWRPSQTTFRAEVRAYSPSTFPFLTPTRLWRPWNALVRSVIHVPRPMSFKARRHPARRVIFLFGTCNWQWVIMTVPAHNGSTGIGSLIRGTIPNVTCQLAAPLVAITLVAFLFSGDKDRFDLFLTLTPARPWRACNALVRSLIHQHACSIPTNQ